MTEQAKMVKGVNCVKEQRYKNTQLVPGLTSVPRGLETEAARAQELILKK